MRRAPGGGWRVMIELGMGDVIGHGALAFAEGLQCTDTAFPSDCAP